MSLHQDKPLQWYGATGSAEGVSVTPVSTAWGNSAIVQVVASTAEAIQIDSLTYKPGSTATGVFGEIDLLTGASGSEVVISTVKFAYYTQNTGSTRVIRLPIMQRTVGAGTRLSVRLRVSDTATTAASISVGYLSTTSTSNDFITTPLKGFPVPTAGTAASGYGTVAPSGTAWTFGTAVELTSNTTTGINRLASIIAINGATTQNIEAEVEVLYGTSVGTAVSAGVVKTMMRATAQGFTNINLPAGFDIPAGNRIYVRVREGSTSVTAWKVAIMYYESSPAVSLSINPDNMAVATTSNDPTITQAAPLSFAPDNMALATTSSEPTTSVIVTLAFAPDNSAVATSSDSPSVGVTVSTAPDNLTVATLTSEPSLAQTVSTVPADMAVATTSDQPTISQAAVVVSFTPDNQAVATLTSQPTNEYIASLTADSMAVSTLNSEPALAVVVTVALTPDSMSLATISDQPTTAVTVQTSPDSMALATLTSQPTLEQVVSFSPDGMALATTSDQPTFTQTQSYAPDSMAVGVSMEQPTVGETVVLDLNPDNSFLATQNAEPTIAQTISLSPADQTVSTSTDQPTLVKELTFDADGIFMAAVNSEPDFAAEMTFAPAALSVATSIEEPITFDPNNIPKSKLRINLSNGKLQYQLNDKFLINL